MKKKSSEGSVEFLALKRQEVLSSIVSQNSSKTIPALCAFDSSVTSESNSTEPLLAKII
jgi:hypothetical protein